MTKSRPQEKPEGLLITYSINYEYARQQTTIELLIRAGRFEELTSLIDQLGMELPAAGIPGFEEWTQLTLTRLGKTLWRVHFGLRGAHSHGLTAVLGPYL